jgi:hypothetical protein
MTDLQRLQREAGRWADEVFGQNRTPDGEIAHLLKEVEKELTTDPHDINEYADCLLLLLGAARNAGHAADDVVDAAWEKLEVNRHRDWAEPGPDGVVEHVREAVG